MITTLLVELAGRLASWWAAKSATVDRERQLTQLSGDDGSYGLE